jgi:uncharacterized membrane protein
MPESKSRHAHKHPHHQEKQPATPSKTVSSSKRILIIAMIFFAVIGLVIGFLIDSSSVVVMLAGTVIGIAAGYFAGQELKKSLSGK